MKNIHISKHIKNSEIFCILGGIYYEPECSSHNLNLDVLAVGYGVDENGESYYILKNWLGEDWGEGGYFKLARNRCNHCGVATTPIYPIM